MNASLHRTVALARLLFIALLISGCGDLGNVNGCPEISRWGSWFTGQDGSFEFVPVANGQAKCPVRIVLPDEDVIGGGLVIEEKQGVDFPTTRAVLQIENSAGRGLAAKLTPFFRFDIYENHADVFASYPAATALHNYSDHDVLHLNIRKFCDCGYDQVVAELKVGVTYVPDGPLRSVLSGNDVPVAGSIETWQVSSDNGGRPHQFEWYRDEVHVASGDSYTGETGATPFNLRVDVTDSYGRAASTTLFVDVGGVRVSADGPKEVWFSEGGGTWTGRARGGTAPYTFDWYIDGRYVGTGQDWSGFPGEGGHSLSVQVRDAAGASNWAYVDVTGIGSAACQPVPPAEECDGSSNGR
jgi:hypothetical protein